VALRLEHAAEPGPVDFDAFYAEFAPRVRALIRRRVRNASQVDDLVQETFVRAFNKAGSFDTTKPAWPWLATIASNLVIDASRRRSTTQEQATEAEHLEREAGPASSDPAEQFTRTGRRAAIADALAALPARQRKVLVLREIEELRYDAVAAAEELSLDAVKSTLKRARASFRQTYMALAEERGLLAIGLIPLHYGRATLAHLRSQLSTRTQAAAQRLGTAASGVADFGAAPLAAVVVSLAVGAGGVVGSGAHTSPSPRVDRALTAIAAAGSVGRPAGWGGSATTARAAAARPPVAAAAGGARTPLAQKDAGVSNHVYNDENIGAVSHLNISAFGVPIFGYELFANTQCHVNALHERACKIAKVIPQDVNAGDPQPTPEPAPPPDNSSWLPHSGQ
jgi:RNA polymerase sigma-70 factor (ECF subfamily)